MKKTLVVLITSAIALMGCNEKEQTTFDSNAQYDLQVTVTGMTQEGGNVYISVRDKSQSVIAEHMIPADTAASSASVLLEKLPAGEYDIFTFQDIDGNNQLTMAGMMPKEPLGYSGNNILTGPPQFATTSFVLAANSEQTVTLFDYR